MVYRLRSLSIELIAISSANRGSFSAGSEGQGVCSKSESRQVTSKAKTWSCLSCLMWLAADLLDLDENFEEELEVCLELEDLLGLEEWDEDEV